MVGTLCLQCRGYVFDPQWGQLGPHMPCGKKKKKKERERERRRKCTRSWRCCRCSDSNSVLFHYQVLSSSRLLFKLPLLTGRTLENFTPSKLLKIRRKKCSTSLQRWICLWNHPPKFYFFQKSLLKTPWLQGWFAYPRKSPFIQKKSIILIGCLA